MGTLGPSTSREVNATPCIAGNPANVPHLAGVGPLYKDPVLLALSEKSPARRSDASKLPYSQYSAMGQEHLARPIKSAATGP